METEDEKELIRARYRADRVIVYYPTVDMEVLDKVIDNLEDAAKKAGYILNESYDLVKLE